MKKNILMAIIASATMLFSTNAYAQEARATGQGTNQEQPAKADARATNEVPIVNATVPAVPEENTLFGLKIMLGASNIMDNANHDMRVAYGFGATVEFKLNKLFSIQPEILYMSKGASNTINVNAFNKNVTTKTTISYLEIPVLAKLNIGGNGLLFGPYLGFKLSQDINSKYEDKSNKDMVVAAAMFDPVLSFIDFGLAAGYERKINDRISVDARVDYGISKIIDGTPELYPSIKPFNNPSNFSFMVGFKYSIR